MVQMGQLRKGAGLALSREGKLRFWPVAAARGGELAAHVYGSSQPERRPPYAATMH